MDETKIVRMRTPVRVPGHILGEAEDVPFATGDVEMLPAAYANQLVDDLFAVHVSDDEDEEEGSGEGGEATGRPELAVMSKAELLATATKMGLDVKPTLTKPQLIAAIAAAG